MSIVQNKKALHDFFIEEKYEAGLVLEGWEVKAIRAGRAQLKESYVMQRDNEFFLIGSHISPLLSASTHVYADPTRTRKLLLNAAEIRRLVGKIEQRGYTMVALDLHYSKGRIKAQVALAKGKQLHDKRQTEKDKEWAREKTQILRHQMKGKISS
jgi:SsrA-binding protein